MILTANIQVSGKYPDGRIFVAGGNTFDEFFANLTDLVGPENAGQVVEDFQLLHNPAVAGAVTNASALRTGGAPAASAPQDPWNAAAAPPPPGSPTCDHGARVRRTGTSAKGPWVAWFCPTPKGTPGQCKAQFGE